MAGIDAALNGAGELHTGMRGAVRYVLRQATADPLVAAAFLTVHTGQTRKGP